jgi:hypothetical protein
MVGELRIQKLSCNNSDLCREWRRKLLPELLKPLWCKADLRDLRYAICAKLNFIFEEAAHSSFVFSFRLFICPVFVTLISHSLINTWFYEFHTKQLYYTSILYLEFNMVDMHENFYARNGVEGRDHIPALPFWMAIVRIVQFVCYLQYGRRFSLKCMANSITGSYSPCYDSVCFR